MKLAQYKELENLCDKVFSAYEDVRHEHCDCNGCRHCIIKDLGEQLDDLLEFVGQRIEVDD